MQLQVGMATAEVGLAASWKRRETDDVESVVRSRRLLSKRPTDHTACAHSERTSWVRCCTDASSCFTTSGTWTMETLYCSVVRDVDEGADVHVERRDARKEHGEEASVRPDRAKVDAVADLKDAREVVDCDLQ